jgi:hypothetical protein
MWSLIICGRRDIVDASKVMNLETEELMGPHSPLLDNQESIKDRVLPALQLSEAQEDATAYSVALTESLMAPIAAEIADIQQQLHACISSSSGDGSRAVPVDSVLASDAVAAAAAASGGPGRATAKVLLDEQDRLLTRLRVVLAKQYHIVAGSCCIFISGLTWVQAAKMTVHR